jgi:hypothetical protein
VLRGSQAEHSPSRGQTSLLDHLHRPLATNYDHIRI